MYLVCLWTGSKVGRFEIIWVWVKGFNGKLLSAFENADSYWRIFTGFTSDLFFSFFFQDLCVLLNNNYLKEELDTACWKESSCEFVGGTQPRAECFRDHGVNQ